MSQQGAETSSFARLILIGFSLPEILAILGAVVGLLGLLIVILHVYLNHTRRRDIGDAFLNRFWSECASNGTDANCGCDLCRALEGDGHSLSTHLTQTIYKMDLEQENRRRQQLDYSFKASKSAANQEARQLLRRPQFLRIMQTRIRTQRTIRSHRVW